MRGVWITSTDSNVLDSKQNIAEAMNFLSDTGFNVVFPVVWNKGMTHYPSQVMREKVGVEIASRFSGRDPLAELIEAAHRVNLKVIPWFEYGFASSYNLNGGLLLEKFPAWTARDRAGNLLKKNGFEWMNALDPDVQNFLLSLILEVAKNYDVDGIQGDDRLPALPSEGGYDSLTLKRYYQEFNCTPPYNHKNPHWVQWRANILTQFLERLYKEVKAINPQLIVSMAPNIYDWCLKEYLQDTKSWVEKGLVDIIHPQIYRRDFHSYKINLDKIITQQFSQQLIKVYPAILIKIGSYRISTEHLLQAIKYNRFLGIKGEVFFFYEGLREDNNVLANVLRSQLYL